MVKTCLILTDGVCYDTCAAEGRYLEAAVKAGVAQSWKMRLCLPTISALMYETIHTGLVPVWYRNLGDDRSLMSRCAHSLRTLLLDGGVTDSQPLCAFRN